MPKTHLLDLNRDELDGMVRAEGLPGYRGRQIEDWVFRQHVATFQEMTNLPVTLREQLSGKFDIYTGEIVAENQAQDGTVKLLLQWPDGATSECVLIPDHQRQTACISTQVGCPVGCVFCASGLDGLMRNLTAGQIVEQAMRVRDRCEGRLSNVVFMGLGEPLANYDAAIKALKIINSDHGMNIGARRITVSTVGLTKQMRRFAEEGIQATLALSLHAPTDDLRRQIIPWAERVTIKELIEACKFYFNQTGREVTLEYILLGGLNDGSQHALDLAGVARQMRANVNLIQYNPIEDLPYQRPEDDTAINFQKALREQGVNTHLRRSRGLDVDAACGQLRRRHESNVGPEEGSE